MRIDDGKHQVNLNKGISHKTDSQKLQREKADKSMEPEDSLVKNSGNFQSPYSYDNSKMNIPSKHTTLPVTSNNYDTGSVFTAGMSDDKSIEEEKGFDYKSAFIDNDGPYSFQPPYSYISGTITILHTNDLHGQTESFTSKKDGKPEVGGLERLGAVIKREKACDPDGTLILDAGDISTGGAVSDYFNSLPIVDAMNNMGYDAMTIGNHEFDSGREVLKGIVEQANFPVLSANMVDKTPGKKLDVKPYIIKEVEGFKIGILGLTTPEAFSMLTKEDAKHIQFLSAEETAAKMIPDMKEKGADLIVVLSHLGLESDKKLAESVNGIDVIVGGHSHTELEEHVKVGHTVIVQTGKSGENVGRIDLNISHSRGGAKILSADSELIPIDATSIQPDKDVSGILDKYSKKLAPIMERKIGEARIPLTRRDYHVYMEESNLGNLVTDIVRKKADADVAILAPSALRSTIDAGDVKVEDIYELFPWKNNIVTLNMKGKDIAKVLEEFMDGPALGFTVSGMKVKFDKTKLKGKQIVSITMPDGKPMDPEKNYKVATRDFYAEGKLGLKTFNNYKHKENIADLRDTLIEGFETLGDLYAMKDGRIQNMGHGTVLA